MKINNIFNIYSRRKKTMQRTEGRNKLISANQLKAPATEAYRVLRTNIHYASSDKELTTLLFTSAGPGEGKSTTAANIAVVMAQSGSRVLIVDCDLRKPTLHRIFEVERSNGITNILVENCSLESVAVKTKTKGLDFISSGPIPPNPAELLGSIKFDRFLKLALEEYDRVIIDAPPIIAVTDAGVMASKVDGVVLVCNADIVKPEWAKKAKTLLESAKGNIIGVVLNKVESSGDDYYYYYYYHGGDDNHEKA